MECRVFNNILQNQIYIFFLIVGGLFCTVESRVFFELDGNVANYEDSRYCGGNIKYKIHQR